MKFPCEPDGANPADPQAGRITTCRVENWQLGSTVDGRCSTRRGTHARSRVRRNKTRPYCRGKLCLELRRRRARTSEPRGQGYRNDGGAAFRRADDCLGITGRAEGRCEQVGGSLCWNDAIRESTSETLIATGHAHYTEEDRKKGYALDGKIFTATCSTVSYWRLFWTRTRLPLLQGGRAAETTAGEREAGVISVELDPRTGAEIRRLVPSLRQLPPG